MLLLVGCFGCFKKWDYILISIRAVVINVRVRDDFEFDFIAIDFEIASDWFISYTQKNVYLKKNCVHRNESSMIRELMMV